MKLDPTVYVLSTVPGSVSLDVAHVLVGQWPEFCNNPLDFIFIDHHRYREVSRWTSAENKRPFLVNLHAARTVSSLRVGASATLLGAIKIAQRYHAARLPAHGNLVLGKVTP